MVKHNMAMHRYLRGIQGWLPCSRRLKRRILERIQKRVREYLAGNPGASYKELTERFGTPQQIAAAYVAEMGTDELLRDLRIRRRIIGIIAASAIAVVILWAGTVTAAYLDHVNNVNGYLVVDQVIVTKRNEVE